MGLPHAEVRTPVFMPVGTVGSVKAVPQDVVESLGAQIILGNTYHLYLRPGFELVRRMGGLHRFISWPRAMLTDSGGFQVFSLNGLRKVSEDGVEFRSHLDGSKHLFTPERSIEIQIALGADILMAFDECTEYPADFGRARKSLDTTLGWAKRSLDYFEAHKGEVPWSIEETAGLSTSLRFAQDDKGGGGDGTQVSEARPGAPIFGAEGGDAGPSTSLRFGRDDKGGKSRFGWDDMSWGGTETQAPGSVANQTQSLFGIVQGGMYPELRRESAERLVEMDFPGYAIGGLSVGEPRDLTREVIEATLPHLPKDKPRYVMGVGYPEEIVEYAGMGVDMMDCVLPTRAARHGLLFTSEGRLNIKNRRFAEDQGPADPECGCMVCGRYTRAYLRHLAAAQEPLSMVLNTIHNLAYYLDLMKSVRDAIGLGTLPALLAKVRANSRQLHAE
jgi:queuine tRNA-ribosyltransferase